MRSPVIGWGARVCAYWSAVWGSAAAVALHVWEGEGAPEDYRLLVPGGEVGVHVGAAPFAEGSTVLLTGPAEITGRVVIG